MNNKAMRVIICGGLGKMGRKIADLVAQDKEMKLAGLIEKPGHLLVGGYKDGIQIRDNLELVIKEKPPKIQVDVIIDFTTPEATLEHLEIASRHRKSMIIGTTGFNDEQEKRIKLLSEKISVLKAPNMSTGANLLFELARETAKVLPDYDVEILETHHKQKIDSPSGTAVKLGDVISLAHYFAKRTPKGSCNQFNSLFVYGRKGKVGPRKPNEIGIHSIRVGNIMGDHTAIFGGPDEVIKITHHVLNRDIFAQGAIMAAKWIINQKPGLYDMQDVLGIKHNYEQELKEFNKC